MSNHIHQQQDQSHLLDSRQLYEILEKKLSKRKKQQNINILQTESLKSIIELIQISLKKIINMIEDGVVCNHNDQQLTQSLSKLRNNGFNELDDDQINILIKIDEKVDNFYTSLLDQSNGITQNAIKIQEWCNSQKQYYRLQQKIKDSKHLLINQDQVEGNKYILSSAISKDYKYIVYGCSDKNLTIWNNIDDDTLVKSIQLDNFIYRIKFTDDSSFLYVGTYQYLYQFDVKKKFKEIYIHSNSILNIFCITNTIILTCSDDQIIIKTDVMLQQQLFKIKAHNTLIVGLDYNHNLDMIASSSRENCIKIWNGNNGEFVLEKNNVHDYNDFIKQVLFIKGNQLICLVNNSKILIWKINFETKQLEYQHQIQESQVANMSLVLNQQYLTLVCSEYIRIYSIKSDSKVIILNNSIMKLRSFVIIFIIYQLYLDFYNNSIQPQQMKAIIIQGKQTLQICKVEPDFV